MPIYRKIYERHYGPIPKDSNGRTYEIHHIDGNHSNNHITNLKAVTLQEHYDIHYAQGDWGACTTFMFTCIECEQTFERPDKKYYRKRSFCGKGCAASYSNKRRYISHEPAEQARV